MANVVHVLQHGLPLCGFSKDVPASWPGGHVWTSVDNVSDVTCLPCKKEAGRLVVDAKFIKAGHKPENTSCNHKHYNPQIHGRHCTCGTCMYDPGD